MPHYKRVKMTVKKWKRRCHCEADMHLCIIFIKFKRQCRSIFELHSREGILSDLKQDKK